MDREEMGDHCLVQDIDISEEKFFFDTEQEALQKVAALYAAQIGR